MKIDTDVNVVDIYEKFHTTTKGRICWLDGIMDFKAQRFYKWDEVDFDYYTCSQIPRNYADYYDNPDMDVVETIKRKIFKNLFDGDMEKGLQFLSRAIAGHCEDKNWATYLGNRNCGKGVLYDVLKYAFGDYVATFELANILYQRHTNTDEQSRKSYWMLDLQFRRLAISQETPAPEMKLIASGKALKKMAGGNDTHVARRNYDRVDTHFQMSHFRSAK